ncbi:MAG TPA: hypothetical protein VMV69_01285 [Pirellulales bacterium]|nr:hypothetical protein [Pirellulales bacterium]
MRTTSAWGSSASGDSWSTVFPSRKQRRLGAADRLERPEGAFFGRDVDAWRERLRLVTAPEAIQRSMVAIWSLGTSPLRGVCIAGVAARLDTLDVAPAIMAGC